MTARKGNILPVVLIVLAIAALATGVFWWRSSVSTSPKACTLEAKLCPDGSSVGRTGPNCEFSTCSTPTDPTANWKTFKKSITYYGNSVAFEIKAPSDFSVDQSGGIGLGLQNSSGSIVIGFSYASQGSLTGNASAGEYQPVKNLSVTIQGQKYTPEEYYDTIGKYYVFDILSILDSGRDRQIRANGRYKNEADKALVSQILSTFKFIDKTVSAGHCAPNFPVETGSELTASGNYAYFCAFATNESDCLKTDSSGKLTGNFSRSDGLPHCEWKPN